MDGNFPVHFCKISIFFASKRMKGGVRVNQAMFESIYKAYFGRVYHYLLAQCRDHHLAEELTADTFFKALGSLQKFRGDSDPGTWLCAIARNLYVSHLRKHAPTQPLEELPQMPDPGTPDPAELTEQQEELMGLYARLHRLAEPYKEVFLLRVLGQLSFRQIGQLFGKTENWACVTYHRARKKLQEEECK